MGFAILKINKQSKNYWGLIMTLVGMLIFVYYFQFSMVIDTNIPRIIITTIYFLLLTILFRARGEFTFIVITFFFLVVYFTVISSNGFSLGGIYKSLSANSLPLNIYALVLLPASFLGSNTDFFSLAKQLPKNKVVWFKYLLQVLVKRQLVIKRYNQVIEAFYVKGYNTRNKWVKYSLISKWIIPVVVTTVMEGVESYDYNKMLNHHVGKSSISTLSNKLTIWQYLIFYFLIILLLIGLLHEYLPNTF